MFTEIFGCLYNLMLNDFALCVIQEHLRKSCGKM